MRYGIFISILLLLAGCDLSTDDSPIIDPVGRELSIEDVVGEWAWTETLFNNEDYSDCLGLADLDKSTFLALSFNISEETMSFSDLCSSVSEQDIDFTLDHDAFSGLGELILYNSSSEIAWTFNVNSFNYEVEPPIMNVRLTFVSSEDALIGGVYAVQKVIEE